MTFDWECYLSLSEAMMDKAEELKGDATQECLREAYLRSALSRFYYGVYGIAENILSRYIPKPHTHAFVFCEYESSPYKPVKKVGENLKRLWKYRKKADYDEEIKDSHDEIMDIEAVLDAADKANKKARNTVKQIKELESDGFLTSSTFSKERCEKHLVQSPTRTSPE